MRGGHQAKQGLDERSADFLLRQAYLHRVRGKLPEALRAVQALLDIEPDHDEAIEIKRTLEQQIAHSEAERKEAERARGAFAASVCRGVSIALLIGAILMWSQFTGGSGHGRYRFVPAGPVVFGLRQAYWYAVGAILLLIASGAVWLLRYRWVPDWTDLDKPDPKGRYGYRWWW